MMPDAGIKINSPILNKNLPVTSNDPDVVFKLLVDRLIGPNKKTTYGIHFCYIFCLCKDKICIYFLFY